MNYGKYKGNIYRLSKLRDNKYYLFSWSNENDFKEVPSITDYKGVIHSGRYKKEIEINALEDAYALKYEAVYKGIRFDAALIEYLHKEGRMEIWTEDDDIAEKYDFERIDMFWYYKYIEGKDIEELVEIREPIFQFKDTKKVTKQVIPKDKILQYSEYIASFA
ncbi:MAG: hypothetical protein GYA50_04825 [Eubacteriaceae bacterium]|nr:hypothetical protein [Eubacteriaceae bacterium]